MQPATLQVRSPGRVNLLGEHVDKNDGKVLPAAIDREIRLTAYPRGDDIVRVRALDLKQSVEFNLSNLDHKVDTFGEPLPSWAHYPAGVAWSLQRAGFSIQGVDCEFTSDIPIGAGLSSSAAVEVGFAVMWQALGGWEMDRLGLSRYCQQAEVEYAGVNCGLMDQFACANGVAGHAVLLDTRSLEFKPVPLPENVDIVIADSTIRRTLMTSAYNDRVNDCQMAVKVLQKTRQNISSLRDVSPGELESVRPQLSESVYRHARHVVSEIERVERAIRCLEEGDSDTFGRIMVATHASLRDDYEVSCPELDVLVEIAVGLKGCLGARLTGAGFGGCTVSLVNKDLSAAFVRDLAAEYHRRTGLHSPVFITTASQGARIIQK